MKPIAAGVLCAALAGCAALGGERTVTDKKNGFEITVPEKWAKYEALPANGFAIHRDTDQIWAAVEISDLKDGESLRSFFEDPIRRKQFKDCTLIDIRTIRLNKANGLKLSLAVAERRIELHYIVAGERGYTIWVSAPKVDFEKYAADFDGIVKSFKLLKTE